MTHDTHRIVLISFCPLSYRSLLFMILFAFDTHHCGPISFIRMLKANKSQKQTKKKKNSSSKRYRRAASHILFCWMINEKKINEMKILWINLLLYHLMDTIRISQIKFTMCHTQHQPNNNNNNIIMLYKDSVSARPHFVHNI